MFVKCGCVCKTIFKTMILTRILFFCLKNETLKNKKQKKKIKRENEVEIKEVEEDQLSGQMWKKRTMRREKRSGKKTLKR